MKFLYAGVIAALVLTSAAWYAYQGEGSTYTGEAIQLKGEMVRITVADSPLERSQGLSGREGLAADEGMLFVFPEDGVYGFWMKDMLFSIDMLWLDASGNIVHIEKRVAPETYPQSFSSTVPARYVLELPAGYSDEHNLSVGDNMEL